MYAAYIIVNDFDRPCPRLVAKQVDSKAYYLNRATESGLKSHDGMETTQASTLFDFGFNITEQGDKVHFKQVRPSTVKYSMDNSPRVWQGEKEFTLPQLQL